MMKSPAFWALNRARGISGWTRRLTEQCRLRMGVVAAVLLAGLCLTTTPFARAAGPVAYCSAGSGHTTAQKVPPELVPEVAKAFDISADMVRDAASVRCVGTRLLACWVGANLDCGKADTRRSLPSADSYCRLNPGADGVPMAATGHDTIYDWRCVGSRAVAGKILMPVDAQGYIADNWKPLR